MNITDQTFDSLVTKSHLPVILCFSATWCGPCKAVYPILDRIAQRHAGFITVFKVDVDQNPETVSKFPINAVPTVFILKNGQRIGKFTGGNITEKVLLTSIEPHFS
jgi:thioredoxin 1